MTELQSLQNAANALPFPVTVHEYNPMDKRKSIKRYYLQSGQATISPNLDYNEMQHFLLGMLKSITIISKTPF